jgi:cyclic dehypoxanthinyl futalosine synthase
MASSNRSPTYDSTVAEIESAVAAGERLTGEQGKFLFQCTDLLWLGAMADLVRNRINPGRVVTYVIDRNINYSNVCVTLCKFCAFYRKPGDSEAYVLPREEIGRKIDEAKALGATSILLQGGHHPRLKIEYYEDLFNYIKRNNPVHLHALSPSEILHIAKVSGISLGETLKRLKASGLGSIPGGGAEILNDRVRQEISPYKNDVSGWLDVMKEAHKLGLKTSATMMFGHVEHMDERLDHLLALRELQDQTGGFTAFIPWTFQPLNTALDEQQYHLRNNGATDYLKTVAVSRLMLDNFKSIQASWVTQGAKAAQVSLMFGANDFGSTMIEENVVKAAGVEFRMREEDIVRYICDAGYKPRRRTILYEILGKPLVETSTA